jgi:hypothetical protein
MLSLLEAKVETQVPLAMPRMELDAAR